ncbi:hypothetical protein [Legionella norrlandica]|nr:hypothetical protein [Legionella norrlandica]
MLPAYSVAAEVHAAAAPDPVAAIILDAVVYKIIQAFGISAHP